MLRGVFALLIFFSVAISYSYQLDSTVVSIPFCEDQSESFCNKCNSGYEISNTKRCRITNCLFYDYEQDLCLQCMTGFLRIANTCVQRPKGSLPTLYGCTSVNLFGACVICGPRLLLENGFCLTNFCTAGNGKGVCTTCIKGTTIQGDKTCKPDNNPNCIIFSAETGLCTQCGNLYYRLTDSSCQRVSDACLTFNYTTSTCTKCSEPQIPSGPNCVPPPAS